jgi:pimeloyl-ACP methyl ester carboxylesterase
MPRLAFKIVISFYCLLLFTPGSFAQEASIVADKTGHYYNAADGLKIYYEVQGQGQPIILVHGFRNTMENWKRKILYQDLLNNGYKVVVLDLRGNGKSDKPNTVAGYEKDAEVRDIMGLASALKFKSYMIAGYSRGAIITARLLVQDKRITKAVLGGMGDAFTNPNWPRRTAFLKSLTSQEKTPEVEQFIKSAEEQGLDVQQLTYQQQAQPTTSVAEIKKIKIPVLVISGEEDNDNGSAEALANLLPQATVKRTPGVHNTAWQTQQFAQEVLTFLQKK